MRGAGRDDISTYDHRDDEVKHVPLVLPEAPKVVDPLEQDLGREDDDGEGVDEVEQLLQHHQPGVVRHR